jgi:hypothetical protein
MAEKTIQDKQEAQERAYLVRLHEANCSVEHPSESQEAFAQAVRIAVAHAFGFARFRGVRLVADTVAPRPAPKA